MLVCNKIDVIIIFISSYASFAIRLRSSLLLELLTFCLLLLCFEEAIPISILLLRLKVIQNLDGL